MVLLMGERYCSTILSYQPLLRMTNQPSNLSLIRMTCPWYNANHSLPLICFVHHYEHMCCSVKTNVVCLLTWNLCKKSAQGVDFVVDGGERLAYPSTVVDMTGQMPKILRRGKVSNFFVFLPLVLAIMNTVSPLSSSMRGAQWTDVTRGHES